MKKKIIPSQLSQPQRTTNFAKMKNPAKVNRKKNLLHPQKIVGVAAQIAMTLMKVIAGEQKIVKEKVNQEVKNVKDRGIKNHIRR